MNPKPNHIPTEPVIPPIKMKNSISRRRMVASIVLTMTIASLATAVLMLLLAILFAPQLSNTLWNTDATQQALYGTSAAVQNAQVIVDMTSTALAIQASDQQGLLDSLNQRETRLDAREADLIATDDAIAASIIATQTAEVLVNEQQRTQAAVNYSETQSSINQQSTLIAIQATSTQLALDTRQQPATEDDTRPFEATEDAQFVPYSITNCNWQGVGGTVYDAQDSPITTPDLQVRVLGEGADTIVILGDNLGIDEAYNWAIQLDDEIANTTYFLRLENLSGQAMSPMVRVTFDASCDKNLAVVNFTQIDPDSD